MDESKSKKMDAQKVDIYLMTNSKFFEPHQIVTIRDILLRADDSKEIILHSVSLKDPVMMLIISIIAGGVGVDRFIIGDTGMGIGKLLTCGGLGIWTLVDWFLIMGRTREVNYNKLMSLMI